MKKKMVAFSFFVVLMFGVALFGSHVIIFQTITQITDDGILVGTDFAGEVLVTFQEAESVKEAAAGDKVLIFCTGKILETHPARIKRIVYIKIYK